jgi:DNA-binding PadR family transcriptional regulator
MTTRNQAIALRHIDRHGHATVTALADAECLDDSAAYRALAALEEDGTLESTFEAGKKRPDRKVYRRRNQTK